MLPVWAVRYTHKSKYAGVLLIVAAPDLKSAKMVAAGWLPPEAKDNFEREKVIPVPNTKHEGEPGVLISYDFGT